MDRRGRKEQCCQNSGGKYGVRLPGYRCYVPCGDLRSSSAGIDRRKDIVALAAGMDMTVKPEADAMHVVVNGHDVTDYIRTPEVSARVSAVSALAGVRAAMVGIQRRQAAKGGIVLDGRDIGTTVLPHADVKIFLTASVHTRAFAVSKK